MTQRTARIAGLVALLICAATLTQPAQASAPAPQNNCSGAFCVTFDLGTFDALAPTQATTAAAQPTNLALRFTNTSPTVATDKTTWLAKVSAVLGSSSSKGFAVTDPAQLPLSAYVAGSASSAAGCASATDFASACPAGFGTGLVEAAGLQPTAIKSATYGISRITTGAGGALTAELTVRIDGELLPSTTTTPVTYSPATATSGATLTMDTRPTVTPPLGYLSAEFSMNTVALNLNGLVTEAATGAVNPSVAFVRQSPLCTTVTSTLAANARGTATAVSTFPQSITGCPAAPQLTSVTPVPGQPLAVTFTTAPPVAAVPGRGASIEWVFGDGAKALTVAATTHTYPTANAVVALATVVDSAGARSTTIQVRIAGARLRVKQTEGNRLAGVLADQDTGNGVAGQQVDAYRCASRTTPLAQCDRIGTGATRADGSYRIRIPEVTKKSVAVVAYAGTASKSATDPARFGAQRALTVLPQPDVTLHVSDKTVRPGATVRLSGKVDPGKKGKTVRLQGFLRGKWRSIGKATISQTGRYAATYTVLAPKQDKVKVRALIPGTAATLEATSPVKVIRFNR